MLDGIFNIMINVMPIVVICLSIAIFVFVIIMIFSPKAQGKMMSRQVKTMKYMLDNAKKDLTDIGSTMGNVNVDIKKNIMDQNEETLKDLATKEANISKEKIEITARAIKDGLSGEKIYCKHCGKSIDENSKFCKYCGKEV